MAFNISAERLPSAIVYASRGCRYSCNFCAVKSIQGEKWRTRSISSILREMEFLMQQYGVRDFVFYDDNFVCDKDKSKLLMKEFINRKYNITWRAANLFIPSLDTEMLELMRESGCNKVTLAIESGNQRILKEVINKPLCLNQVKSVVNAANDLDFFVLALFIIGNPTETWDEIRNTIKFAEELNATYSVFSIATPLPNTKLYRTAVDLGILQNDFSFFNLDGMSKGCLCTDEFTPFDLEVLRLYEWDRINFSDPRRKERLALMNNITVTEIDDMRNAAFRKLHLKYVSEGAYATNKKGVEPPNAFIRTN